jgi:hypothetical protein
MIFKKRSKKMAAPLCRHLTHYKYWISVSIRAIPPCHIVLLEARFILDMLRRLPIKMQAHLADVIGVQDQIAPIPPTQLFAGLLVVQVVKLAPHDEGIVVQNSAKFSQIDSLMIHCDLMHQICGRPSRHMHSYQKASHQNILLHIVEMTNMIHGYEAANHPRYY